VFHQLLSIQSSVLFCRPKTSRQRHSSSPALGRTTSSPTLEKPFRNRIQRPSQTQSSKWQDSQVLRCEASVQTLCQTMIANSHGRKNSKVLGDPSCTFLVQVCGYVRRTMHRSVAMGARPVYLWVRSRNRSSADVHKETCMSKSANEK
jgi:hypothetical protein